MRSLHRPALVNFMDLLQKYPSILNWLKPRFNLDELKTIQVDDGLLKLYNVPQVKELMTSINQAFDKGFKLLCPTDKAYPFTLNYHFMCPTPLLIKGNFYQNKKILSVVGSRNCSTISKEWMNTELKKFLKNNDDIIIASGGAYGIDQLAHSISLQMETPTFCILPTGVNNIYPSNLSPLCDQMIRSGGALISPFPPNHPVFKSNFHFRNRILVLLSHYVFVVEARRRSGSMMTASLTSEYGVPLLTLPQPPLPSFMGNLDLIERGIPFVSTGEDLKNKLSEIDVQSAQGFDGA